jgi:hypothetical protein
MCLVNVWYVLCNILHICHPRVFYDQVQSYYLSIQQIFVSVVVVSHFPSTTIYQDLLQKYQVSYKKYILLVHRKQMGSQPTLFRWGLCCLSFKFSVGFFLVFFLVFIFGSVFNVAGSVSELFILDFSVGLL